MYNPIYYQFPECLWPSNNSEYIKGVKNGYDLMRDSSVIICGLARNLSSHINYTIARLEYLSSLFNKCKVIIYTNDNEDGTGQSLNVEFISNSQDWILLWENLNKTFHGSVSTSQRYIDMAYYRNQYLKEAYKYNADYLVVLDTDVLGGYSWNGIAHSINSMNGKVGCIGSNSLIYNNDIRLYYDSLAFRRLNSEKRHDDTEINLFKYNRGETLVQLQSCFGGVAIYNFSTLKNNNLCYEDYDCDHVTLNRKLINLGYSNYLNPSMITLYSHSEYTRI